MAVLDTLDTLARALGYLVLVASAALIVAFVVAPVGPWVRKRLARRRNRGVLPRSGAEDLSPRGWCAIYPETGPTHYVPLDEGTADNIWRKVENRMRGRVR